MEDNNVVMDGMNLDDLSIVDLNGPLRYVEDITVEVVNESNNNLPEYETLGAAGMDLRADISEPYQLDPGQIKLIPTGLKIKLPIGYELQVRPRSGLALKHGISVLNSPGCVDCDYRGIVGVILINLGGGPFIINPGDRIAQAIVTRYARVNWNEVTELDKTERSPEGFGSTGVK